MIRETFKEKDMYMALSTKYKGLLDIKVKFPVIDKKALSLVYTPGVAASCLEIQKKIDESYKYTNKLNSVLIVTDSSSGNFKREKWNDLAPIPYLEGIATIYKKLGNIDCYPLVIKSNEIKSPEEFNELISKTMAPYSGIEFYNVDSNLINGFLELRAKNQADQKDKFLTNPQPLSDGFCSVSSIDKHTRKTAVNIHLIYAAALRVALDVQAYTHLNDLIEEMISFSEKSVKTMNDGVYWAILALIDFAYTYLEKKGLVNSNSGSYNIVPIKISKEFVLCKYERFITEGARGWVDDIPELYKSSKETNDKNSLILHQRYKGVIEANVKVPFQSANEMLRILTFKDFEMATELIIEDPKVAKEITCHSNLGAIMTNGTAILGLGDIGALAGLPVMEGKSVLFKLFGGVDIMPFCIQEKNQEKFVRLASLITPIFSVINLEDIRSPECFYVEPKLDEMCDFPVFHDDQHGTAIVVLAATINALKLAKKSISEVRVVMNGAGAAGLSVAKLLITYGCKHFVICDTKGAIYKDRKDNMNEFKMKLAEVSNQQQIKGKLEDVIRDADIFIGLSSGGALTKDMVRTMNKGPIIFALANPNPEIYPNEAYEAGAFIAATGRSDFPNQINNSMAFPGIFRAAVDVDAFTIDINMKIAAAEGIANSIPEDQLRFDRILPSALDTNVFIIVAKTVANVAEKEGKIRKKGIKAENVEENVDAWFHEGYLRTKF